MVSLVTFGELDVTEQIPCPRLELRWEKIEQAETEEFPRFNWQCVYSMVLPLGEYDIRSTDVEGNPREKFLEIGITKTSMSGDRIPVYDGKVDTPYRDGAHAQWDCKALGGSIPIVAICGDVVTIVPYPSTPK